MLDAAGDQGEPTGTEAGIQATPLDNLPTAVASGSSWESDGALYQFSGLNAITVPGTLRDSLVLLAVVLEQQTELQPTQIMTDTGAYSDVVFGLFRLLGYHFSPRLADVGVTTLPGSPAQFGKLIVNETEKWAKVVKEANIRVD